MKNLYVLIALSIGFLGFAQEKASEAELLQLSQELEDEYLEAKKIADIKYADHPVPEGAAFQGMVHNIPVYVASDSQSQIKSMEVDRLYDGSVPNLNATGAGLTGYIWDGGKARVTHRELEGRAINSESTGNNSSHATGVASVMIGAGISNNAKGMAFESDLKIFNFTNGNTTSEMTAQAALSVNQNYMVSNHSYGSLCGWSYNSSQSRWYWYGYPAISETESVLFGFYTNIDRAYDLIAYKNPQYSFFKSSGNNHGEGPNGTVDHYAYDMSGNWEFFSGVYRPKDCNNTGGYDCLAFSGGVAKNNILVGAIRPISGNGGRYMQPSDVIATNFTSFGPTDDGRIKPDVVAIGQNVYGATNVSNSSYGSWDGTSFSAPAAAGVGLLLQQVKNDYDGGWLTSDMTKALLINTAFEAGNAPGPDYRFGFGLINALKAAETIMNVNGDSYTGNHTLYQDAVYEFKITAKGAEPIKATIAWIDVPAVAPTQLILNDRTPMLVNDLDLRIEKNGEIFYPWKLNPDNPAGAAYTGDNEVDNVEQIVIDDPQAGDVYTLTVTHKGNLETPVSPAPPVNYQKFALVINGVDSVLGTKDLTLEGTVVIYPNPVKDMLYIKSDKTLSNTHIRIFDTMGQSFFTKEMKSLSGTEKINLQGVPAGVYMVYIKSNEGVISKKIIKK